MVAFELTTRRNFHEVEHGDLLIVEFDKPIYPLKHKIETFRVYENKVGENEIILKKKHNIWFNWEKFLSGQSHVKAVFKVM